MEATTLEINDWIEHGQYDSPESIQEWSDQFTIYNQLQTPNLVDLFTNYATHNIIYESITQQLEHRKELRQIFTNYLNPNVNQYEPNFKSFLKYFKQHNNYVMMDITALPHSLGDCHYEQKYLIGEWLYNVLNNLRVFKEKWMGHILKPEWTIDLFSIILYYRDDIQPLSQYQIQLKSKSTCLACEQVQNLIEIIPITTPPLIVNQSDDPLPSVKYESSIESEVEFHSKSQVELHSESQVELHSESQSLKSNFIVWNDSKLDWIHLDDSELQVN